MSGRLPLTEANNEPHHSNHKSDEPCCSSLKRPLVLLLTHSASENKHSTAYKHMEWPPS